MTGVTDQVAHAWFAEKKTICSRHHHENLS